MLVSAIGGGWPTSEGQEILVMDLGRNLQICCSVLMARAMNLLVAAPGCSS